VAEIYQNRTTDKDRFFGGPSIAQIKKWKTNKSLEITWGMRTRNCRSTRYFENFHKFLPLVENRAFIWSSKRL
jgi:hypothetical protein